jgi:hypothetical protein
MQFAIAIFSLGAMLIVIGLVGGDLSYRGLQVPRVGILPRFTTTITGGVFLACAMAVWLLAEFGHETVGPPAAASVIDPGWPAVSEPATEPAAPASTSDPMVTLQIIDSLTPGAIAEQITLRVDGQEAGTLECSLDSPDDALDLALAPGAHQVTLVGQVWTTQDESVEVSGSGQLTGSPGAQYAVTVTDDGTLGLARAG